MKANELKIFRSLGILRNYLNQIPETKSPPLFSAPVIVPMFVGYITETVKIYRLFLSF